MQVWRVETGPISALPKMWQYILEMVVYVYETTIDLSELFHSIRCITTIDLAAVTCFSRGNLIFRLPFTTAQAGFTK